jgi:hypothetical protein
MSFVHGSLGAWVGKLSTVAEEAKGTGAGAGSEGAGAGGTGASRVVNVIRRCACACPCRAWAPRLPPLCSKCMARCARPWCLLAPAILLVRPPCC